MGAPTRITAGFTQDAKFQPLGDIGIPNPFFYAFMADDFCPYNAANYTVTAAGGSVAATAANGNGGRILFTSGAVSTNFASIQQPVANFQYTSGKKLAFFTRIRSGDIVNSVLLAGLIQTSATPYTVADGIYFTKAAASSNIVVNVVTGSAVIGTATLTGLLTVNTDIDLGFIVDRLGNVKIFAGATLVGQNRQDFAVLGPTGGILRANMTGTLTAVLLNPTLATQAGSAVAQTMVADFLFAAMER